MIATALQVPQILMLGTEKSIATAKMLLELHGKHVGDMQRVHNERELLASKLAVRASSSHRASSSVMLC